MEEFEGGDVLRRMQREQERERRRIRDRERRQSMTHEQRERHLARRRRNYQLRRQRAASNAAAAAAVGGGGFIIPLPPPHLPEQSSAGEASTSDELQGPTCSKPLHCTTAPLPHQGHPTLNLGILVVEGSSSVHLETLAYNNPTNSATRLRLSHVRRLARSAGTNHQVAAELITKEHVPAALHYGSTPKSLRLNCVKRLARSINSSSKETSPHKNHNLTPEFGIQLLGNESFTASS